MQSPSTGVSNQNDRVIEIIIPSAIFLILVGVAVFTAVTVLFFRQRKVIIFKHRQVAMYVCELIELHPFIQYYVNIRNVYLHV